MPSINRKGVNTRTKKKQLSIIVNTNNDEGKYYSNPLWRRNRQIHYVDHPICECCEAHGYVRPAEHVHHIVPFMSGKTEEIRLRLLTSPSNLISLCKTCHYAIHKKIDMYHLQTGCSELTDEEYKTAHNIPC